MSEFVFGTHNAAFVQVMYEEYLRDPSSVGPEWRELFDNGKLAELPIIRGVGSQEFGVGRAPAVQPPATPAASPQTPSSKLPAPPAGATPITGPAARLVANMTDSLTVPTATSFR
ncbi:MAG: 2-oxoglutarate dehydrogenase E1 subunit family protein, partial [Gemmatimonadota bacterium]